MNTPLARRRFSSMLLAGFIPRLPAPRRLRVAGFRCDVTPDLGEPLIWVTPATKIRDPLLAKGVVLDDGDSRCLLCAIDWCGVGGSTDLYLRSRMAAAAGTDASLVALHSVHQHTAPYVDGDGYAIMAQQPGPPLAMSQAFLEKTSARLEGAVRDAVSRLEDFDHVGTGEARVDRVASARRLIADGRLVTRYSTGGANPELAALPEGTVDPRLRSVTLASGSRPLVRLHYYATHPQTFCCDGTVSADFVGAAREEFEREDRILQVYFTGCSGDITVGKYNDTTPQARVGLARRLLTAIRESAGATSLERVNRMRWRQAELRLVPRPEPPESADRRPLSGQDLYRAAITRAFARRTRPLPASSLALGNVSILHLPGEPMLEFQEFARKTAAGRFVTVAGYGDMSPGYLCTDRAFAEGGYEPGASNSVAGTEARVTELIRKLLDL